MKYHDLAFEINSELFGGDEFVNDEDVERVRKIIENRLEANQLETIVTYPCICCEKEIKQIGTSTGNVWERMFDGGIVDRITAGYGSLLDGETYIIAICDDCVESKTDYIRELSPKDKEV